MKMQIARIIAIAALAAAPLASHALGTNEKGCLVGGAAGGVAGNVVGSGNHTLLGAALGCGAGVLVNKERVKRIDAKEREKKYAERKKRERVAQRENREQQPLR
jgi:outer membrane lipoprotein SlyB